MSKLGLAEFQAVTLLDDAALARWLKHENRALSIGKDGVLLIDTALVEESALSKAISHVSTTLTDSDLTAEIERRILTWVQSHLKEAGKPSDPSEERTDSSSAQSQGKKSA